jgi:hypothetical protein
MLCGFERQPFESLATIEYVATASDVIGFVEENDPESTENVNPDPEPPLGAIEICPSEPLLHVVVAVKLTITG